MDIMNAQSPIATKSATCFAVTTGRWVDAEASGKTPAELLLYRSNLLGSDLTVTNFGGGNTSAKLTEIDPLTGEAVEVLWVKGSGGDIGSMKLDGFSTLYQAKLLGLEAHYSGPDDDDKMVGYLPHCTSYHRLAARPNPNANPHCSAFSGVIFKIGAVKGSSRRVSSRPMTPRATQRRRKSGAAELAGCHGSGRVTH